MRVDSGVLAGSEITPLYDPMVAKLIVWDVDREAATRRMARALEEFDIDGVRTLIPFHKAIMASEQWAAAETCRDLIEDRAWLKTLAFPKADERHEDDDARAARADLHGRGVRASASTCACSATRSPRRPANSARPRRAGAAARAQRRSSGGGGGGGDTLASPLQGNVFKVLVEQGATVEEGALVCIIEAMKMENEITAHKAGVDRRAPDLRGRRRHARATPSR